MHTHTYAQEDTCASMILLKHAEEWLLRLKIYAQTCIHIHIHMYIYACIRKIHSLHSNLKISQTTIVVFKINSSHNFFSNYYLTILKLLW